MYFLVIETCLTLERLLFWSYIKDRNGPFRPDDILILNVRGPSYLGLTRSISWLLMPWRRKDIDYVVYVGPGLT